VLNIKYVTFFSTPSFKTVLLSYLTRYVQKQMRVFVLNVRYFYPTLTQNEMLVHPSPTIKCHENPSSSCRVVNAYERTEVANLIAAPQGYLKRE
jgi:hypothetical protein